MRGEVDLLVTERALRLIATRRNSDLMDPQFAESVGTRNVCAKVSPLLAGEIDSIAGLLGISKRRFLEAAFLDAVGKALSILKAEGVAEELGGDLVEHREDGSVLFHEVVSPCLARFQSIHTSYCCNAP